MTSATAAYLRVPATLASLIWCMIRTSVMVAVHAVRLGCAALVPARTNAAAGEPAAAGCAACEFYEGTVTHVRRGSLRHRFDYPVRYCLVDLDSSKAAPACCAAQLADRLTAAEVRELTGCAGKVQLLLLPASAGYALNPICVYYCYGKSGKLDLCLAEVDNTPWADRVTFQFAPTGDVVPKPMHVSPLQDMKSSWVMSAPPPGEALRVSVGCRHPKLGDFFDATLHARRVPPERRAALEARSEQWAWLMPHRVAVWIYWHAAVLLWRGLPFLSHPKSVGALDASKARAETERAAMAGGGCPATFSAMARSGAAGCPYVWRDSTEYPWDG